MKYKIEKILELYKKGEADLSTSINDMLALYIVSKDEVNICEICNETVLINGTCPKCTIELCSPIKFPIDL